jgi:hypothetical protein
MPWAVAFALRADGWWLRSAIVWAKPNPMPESVTDRPTSSYEHVFLLAKQATYYWDADAVREPLSPETHARGPNGSMGLDRSRFGNVHVPGSMPSGVMTDNPAGRNARNVLTIASEPFSGKAYGCDADHFAVMPPSLAEWCVRAATSESGCCPHCRAPWERVTERESRPNAPSLCGKYNGQGVHRTISGGVSNDARERRDAGWRPTCACPQHEPIACTALDPFAGAGTTLLAADRLRRDAIGIELNPAYAVMAERRVRADAPLFAPVGGADTPLFSRAADDAYDAPMRDLFAA